ncbi:MAG: T9SS type A sorting domain-containing protein, partial [Bacteroidetes bacterium]|nr:T9SS type A sorting domain-containing protein [Bacteroidota bacterium]
VVYDLLGTEVARLADGRYPAGVHEFRFDATGLASGVYLYRLEAGSFVQTRRMLLVR